MTEVELHIHVRKNGKLVLTPIAAELLFQISHKECLLTAAKDLGISYYKAWKVLDAISQSVEKPVVKKLRGGKGGGGVMVTDFGELILSEYKAIEQQALKFTQKLNTEINMSYE